MTKKYDPSKIEPKWQKYWEEEKLFAAQDFSVKPKRYVLDMFPYPSGAGLHVGHPEGYTASDIYSRYLRMRGLNVLHPMGWDAFGLPAENYAIRTGTHPAKTTRANIANFKKQIKRLGFSYDWTREIDTTDPQYYRLTQWIFLKLYKAGLAYEDTAPINFCPSCRTGLANEEVEGGCCARCGFKVEKKVMRQWILRITQYAERLLCDLEKLDWPEPIKQMQKNWIGRSEGSNIIFKVVESNENIGVFTTRADTLFGATYLVLAPEHESVQKLVQDDYRKNVDEYIKSISSKTDLERTELQKEKTGVFIGSYAINPINGKQIPIWISDYILASYGTGAVMAVPAHDKRDFDFALKYDLEIKSVVKPENLTESVVVGPSVRVGFKEKLKSDDIKFAVGTSSNGREHIRVTLRNDQVDTFVGIVKNYLKDNWWVETVGTRDLFITREGIIEDYFEKENEVFELCKKLEPLVRKDKSIWEMLFTNKFYKDLVCYEGSGNLAKSDSFNGLNSNDAKNQITQKIKDTGSGDFAVNYKLRDWVFSRQRYWGEPIPVVYCKSCWRNKTPAQKKKARPGIDYAIKDGTSQAIIPVPEKDLPVKLPEVSRYQPSGSGESPLSQMKEWVNTSCPVCQSGATRETNTMPQWAGSCWYYIAYLIKNNIGGKKSENRYEWDAKKLRYWLPVDVYVGGAEHAVLHLLYARFWHKFLFDGGFVEEDEPFLKLKNQGMILAEDGRKMSKSLGNVVNPDDIVDKYGADAFRLYEMFMGPFEAVKRWNTKSIEGVYRFLNRVNEICQVPSEQAKSDYNALNQAINKVSFDIENFKFNTAISALMILINTLGGKKPSKKEAETLLLLLAPFAPHIAEELWQKLGHRQSIFKTSWPSLKANRAKKAPVTLIIQVNGKKRAAIKAERGLSEEEVVEKALHCVNIRNAAARDKIKKTVFIKDKLLNIVV